MPNPKKKRILVVVRSLRIGGMERVAVDLCDAFAQSGHDVHLLSFKRADPRLEPENPSVHVHFVDFDLINRLTVIGLLYEILARSLLNVVVRKSLFYWRGLYTSAYFKLFCRHLERKYGPLDKIIVRGQGTLEYLWAVHDPRMLAFIENVVRPQRYAHRPFLARKLFGGKHLGFVSNGVKASFESLAERFHIRTASLCVYPNPCPLERVRELARETPPDLPDEPFIVNVGRLVKQKNHKLLLNAYQQSGVAHKLLLVGGGENESALRRHAQTLGIAERVIFVGMKKNPYPYMQRATLFVLSSAFEGFGVVLVESLACGTPVVAVDCPGGVRDVLSGELNQFIVPMETAALAEAIRRWTAAPPEVLPEWVERFEATSVAALILK